MSSLLLVAVGARAEDVDYARQVHPLLVEKCGQCHGPARAMAGLSVATRADMLKAGVIVPGKSAGSKLLARVDGSVSPRMPMGGAPLAAAEIDLLRRWVDAGASGEITGNTEITSGWKPQLALRAVSLSAPVEKSNPIDQLLAKNLQGKAPVSDALFARRAYLDLWGLLPPPAELDAFIKAENPDKRARLVAMLLANRKNYSEHWVSFWNDLLHNDEGISYAAGRPSITQWLLASLKSNLPYDQFAAKLLNPADKGDPVGFIQGVNWRGDINASQTPQMQAAQNSAQVFLGINLKCNSCHDSFISHWKLKQAYGLASFYSETPLELVRCDVPMGQQAKAEFLYPELGTVPTDAPLEAKRAAAARMFTTKENGQFARTYVNRVWKRLFGRGIVEPIDDMEAEPFNADLLDWLASDFANHGFDVQRLLTLMMTSEAYQLPAVAVEKGPYRFQGPYYRRLSAEEFLDGVSTLTGEWRIKSSTRPEPGSYAREWQFKSNNLSRMLGRPVRDLAVTDRPTDPSTLQSLELVNGDTLTNLLRKGALRMEGNSEPAPAPLWDSGVTREKPVEADIDVTGVDTLRLLLVNHDSYDASRVKVGWIGDDVPGAKAPLKPRELPEQQAVLVKVGSELVVDLRGKHLTRFKVKVAVDEASVTSEISPSIRAFIFKDKPNPEQLIPAVGVPPVAWSMDRKDFVGQIYRYALARDPNAEERRIGTQMLTQPQGLQDLLWCVVMLPEFQYIR